MSNIMASVASTALPSEMRNVCKWRSHWVRTCSRSHVPSLPGLYRDRRPTVHHRILRIQPKARCWKSKLRFECSASIVRFDGKRLNIRKKVVLLPHLLPGSSCFSLKWETQASGMRITRILSPEIYFSVFKTKIIIWLTWTSCNGTQAFDQPDFSFPFSKKHVPNWRMSPDMLAGTFRYAVP